MAIRINIVGNDLEIEGEKVARIFDVRPTLRDKLIEIVDFFEDYGNDKIVEKMEEHWQKGYDEGKQVGLEEGRQEGYEQRESEDAD